MIPNNKTRDMLETELMMIRPDINPDDIKGPQGDKGADGKQGKDGASINYVEIATIKDTNNEDVRAKFIFSDTDNKVIETNEIDLPRGRDGKQGDKGDIGPIGKQGLKGEQGVPGLMGEQGIQGIQGIEGPIGPKGHDGDVSFNDLTPEQKATLKGDEGKQGIQGVQGERGDRGPEGHVGPKGNSYTSIKPISSIVENDYTHTKVQFISDNPSFNTIIDILAQNGLSSIHDIKVSGTEEVNNETITFIDIIYQDTSGLTKKITFPVYAKNGIAVSPSVKEVISIAPNEKPYVKVNDDKSWTLYLNRGNDGLQGIQGEKGIQGERGYSFVKLDVIQKVSGSGGDQTISFQTTDEAGTKLETNTVMLPKGEKGDTGHTQWADMTDAEKAQLKGEQGKQGVQGIQGIQGQRGVGVVSITSTQDTLIWQ